MRTSRAFAWVFGAGLASAVLLALWPAGRSDVATPPVSVRASRVGADADRRSDTAGEIPMPSCPPVEQVLPSIWAEQDPLRREELLRTAADKVSLAEIPRLVAWLQAGPEREAGLELSARLVRRWAEKDAPSAAAWGEQLPAGRNRRNTLEQVAVVWARQDAAAAAGWASQLPAEEEWSQTLALILSESVRSAPRAALAVAGELPASRGRDEIVLRAVAEWAASVPTDASVWAKQIDDPALRERAIAAIATASGEREPRAAAQLALSALPPGRLQDDVLVGIVQRWAQTDPAQAAAWVEGFAHGELRSTAIENLATLWADRDAARALQWLDRLPSVAGTTNEAAMFFRP